MFGGVGLYLNFAVCYVNLYMNAKSVGPDQMLHSAAPHLSLAVCKRAFVQ